MSSKKVLVLGAGLVSPPIIDYLYKNTDYLLTVADILIEKAEKVVKGNPRGKATRLDVKNEESLQALVAETDLVVSLLPYTLHSIVAGHCLEAGKHMINASYVSDEMRAFDAPAREKGLLFLCEMGLDPGIDHMSAMKIIHAAQQAGGKVKEFVSVCGGLPSPEANDNPFGYKFSWSPKGVLLAGNNPARFIAEGHDKRISAEMLFHATQPIEIDGRQFEAYPNRDSVPYAETYGLEGIDLLMRGTLRYARWHDLILALKSLHLLEERSLSAGDHTFPDILAHLNDLSENNVKEETAKKLDLAMDSTVMNALAWLGLFDDTVHTVPETTVLDLLADQMAHEMAYSIGERDMVVLQHRFKVVYPEYVESISSTLIDYGIPHGSSSMARTVSLPLAIGAKLILEGELSLRGVQIPVHPSIYEPVLAELENLGIRFEEAVTREKH